MSLLFTESAGRLAATPGVQKFPNSRIDLFVVRDFLDPGTCAHLCAMIDARKRPSLIADDIGVANYRTSETSDLDEADPVVVDLNRKLSDLLGIPLEYGEPLQGQRYAPGQEFKAHTDYFEPDGADFHTYTAQTGQRTWTAMAYLNTVDVGGATRFKVFGKSIQPETGKLVTWNNRLSDGRVNPATLHHATKVRQGLKYVVTKWFRERPRPTA